jgi:signal transduction histidine kinase
LIGGNKAMNVFEKITFRNGPAEATGTRAPFLARKALFALALAPPLLTLITSQIGPECTLRKALGCLAATWICTLAVGFALHFVVDSSARRLLSAGVGLPATVAALAAIGAVTIVVGMAIVLPCLAWIPQRDFVSLVLRALGIGGLYVIVARLTAVLMARAKASDAGAARARIAALQAQVSPHFLFNTLNAIASLIPLEPDRAEATLERLAGVLQYSISSGMVQTVPLGEELATVRDYLGIERARFGSRLRSSIDVSLELQEQAIPPMLLQPLVENAILHGLAGRAEGGEVWIKGHTDHGHLVLTVSDDGVGPNKSLRRGNRTGLNSVRERLALTYGEAAAFAVRTREGGGFECELRVPRA